MLIRIKSFLRIEKGYMTVMVIINCFNHLRVSAQDVSEAFSQEDRMKKALMHGR